MKALIVISILSLLLTACGAPADIKQKNKHRTRGKYRPITNSKPHYFITLSGKIAPKLQGKQIPFSFKMTYYTMNPKCNITTNWFEGVESAQTQQFTYDIDIKKKNYELKIALNRYQPGFCQWAIRKMSYSLPGQNETVVAYFTPCGSALSCKGQNIADKSINYSPTSRVRCDKNRTSKWICPFNQEINFFSDGLFIPRDKNYHFTLNLNTGGES